MSEWRSTKLGDIISIKGGYSYKGEHIGKGTSLLLGMGCVSFSENFLYSGARLYSGDVPDKFIAHPNDIVLATRQQSDNLPILGVPAIIPDNLKNKKIIVGTNLYKVENKSQVKSDFLYWLLKNVDYRNHIDSCAKGSTVKMITKDAVESYEFLCPPENERNLIAGTLWSITDKIDLLHRQNATLEKMAETLFRQWFVEEAKEEWEVGNVLDLFKLQRGYDLPSQNREDGNIPIITSSGPNGFHIESKVKGPGVTTGRSGVIGKVFYVEEDFWPLNTSLFVLEFKRATPLYTYFFLKTLDLASLNGGSAVPTLNRNDVHALETELPPIDLINRFEEMVQPYFKKIKSNQTQIRTLTTLRDTLLPKLMSGEIRVEPHGGDTFVAQNETTTITSPSGAKPI